MNFFAPARRFAFVVAAAVMVCSFFSGASFAQAFTLSPVLFDKTMDPGSSTQGIVHVLNDGPDQQTYYASVQNFVAQGEAGQQTFLPLSDTSALASWLHVDSPSFPLAPGQARDIRWSLGLPKDAEPGGHYAALFFSTLPPNAQNGSTVGVGSKTGVLFFVNINGNVVENADIESFGLSDNATVISQLPASFELRIRNSGSVHFVPRGTIVITNMFGSTVGKINVNPNANRVLPGSIREIASAWGAASDLAFGRYTATVQTAYSDRSAPLTVSVSFWVFPWRSILAACFGLILLVLLLKLYNRSVIRSAVSRVREKQ